MSRYRLTRGTLIGVALLSISSCVLYGWPAALSVLGAASAVWLDLTGDGT